MIFAVTNQKGGVGKTTTVLNLGAYLASHKKSVLLVDIDPQANLTSGIGMIDYSRKSEGKKTSYNILVGEENPLDVIQKTKVDNLYILPSSIELAGAEVEMVSSFSRENILKKALSKISKDYD